MRKQVKISFLVIAVLAAMTWGAFSYVGSSSGKNSGAGSDSGPGKRTVRNIRSGESSKGLITQTRALRFSNDLKKIEAVGQRLNSLSTDELTKLCNDLITDPNEDDSLLLSAVLGEGISRDPTSFFLLLKAAPSFMLANSSGKVFSSLAERDPEKLLGFMNGLNLSSGVDSTICRQAVEALTRVNGQMAIQYLEKSNPNAVGTVFETLAATDPNAALSMAMKLKDKSLRTQAIEASIRSFSYDNPAQCFASLKALPDGAGNAAMQTVFSAWITRDWSAAYGELCSLPAPALLNLLQTNNIFDLSLAHDPQLVDQLVRKIPLTEGSVALYEKMLAYRKDIDLKTKIDGLSLLADGPFKNQIIQNVLAGLRGDSIAEGLSILKGITEESSRNSAIAGMASAMVNRSPEERMQFFNMLKDDEKDAAMAKIANKLPIDEGRELVDKITDPALKKATEGRVWQVEKNQLQKEANATPGQLVDSIVAGQSKYADYWLEEAMGTWVAKDFDKAQEWYQQNWKSLPASKSQYVAAAFANQALKQGDTATASQWAGLIQDPKTKQRIQDGISKAGTNDK